MNRRKFVQLASAAPLLPAFLRLSSCDSPEGNQRTPGGRKLVVIQLGGGNDGLNTVIPYAHDPYYQLRPTVGISAKEVLPLDKNLGLGLNPAFAPLLDLFDRGEMSIVNQVGYPNPDRSHFRSMDIWHTASGSERYWQTGWLGRYLDAECADKSNHHALEIGTELSLANRGIERNAFVLDSNNSLPEIVRPDMQPTALVDNSDLDFLYKTIAQTEESVDYLRSQVREAKVGTEYPRGAFGHDLRKVAELMIARSDTQIYYVSMSGYDTHSGQINRQRRLLDQYAQGVRAFTNDLKREGLFDETVILTFSEFGRRVGENAAGGTDHGTANNVYLMGGNLAKAGFYNGAPDLQNLSQGDLIHEVDFRSVYTEVIQNVFQGDAANILDGKFDSLGILA